MDWIERQRLEEELSNMDLTKEQYLQFCELAEEMDLEFINSHKED